MRYLIGLFLAFIIINPSYCYQPKSGDVVITDFEKPPYNNFAGVIGPYGAITGSGFTLDESFRGSRSYKIIYSQKGTVEKEHFVRWEGSRRKMKEMRKTESPHIYRKIDWAVMMMNMGPFVDTSVTPMAIGSQDMSGYRYLVFWVKGQRGGEKFRVYLRDAHAETYEAQLKINPHVVVQNYWRPVKIKLDRLKNKIDLTKIVQIGIGFGRKDGNRHGNVIYLDDFILIK